MMDAQNSSKVAIWLSAVVIFVYALFFYAMPLQDRPFYTRGEGREALVVSSMYEQDNFILPLRGGKDIPSKPPMFHWLAAVTSEIMGEVSEFSIRFPSAFCAALGLGLFFIFVAYNSGIVVALLSILIGATSLEWFRNTTHARVDMVFSFWLTLGCISLYYFWKDWLSGRSPRRLWYIFSGIAIGATILAKGPAGFIIPWLIAGVFVIVETKKEGFWWLLKNAPYFSVISSVLISLVVAGTWYGLAYQQGGDDFIKVQLVKENVSRIVDVNAPSIGHSGPFYESFLFLLLGFLPWTIFLPIVVMLLWKHRDEMVNKNRPLLYCLIWVMLFLVAVSISRSKREVYLLPIYLPLSYMLAHSLTAIFQSRIEWRHLKIVEKVIGAILGFIAVGIFAVTAVIAHICFLGYRFPAIAKLKQADQMQVAAVVNLFSTQYMPWLLIGVGIICVTQAAMISFFGNLKKASLCTGSAMLLFLFTANFYVMPVIFAVNSPREFIKEVVSFIDGNGKLFEYKSNFYAASFYAERKIYPMATRKDLPKEGAFVLVEERDLSSFLKEVPEAVLIMESKTNAANGRDRMCLVQVISTGKKQDLDDFI